jgi:hypothetical protein
MVTANGWLSGKHRAFSMTELEGALHYLDVASERLDEIKRRIVERNARSVRKSEICRPRKGSIGRNCQHALVIHLDLGLLLDFDWRGLFSRFRGGGGRGRGGFFSGFGFRGWLVHHRRAAAAAAHPDQN